MASAEAPAEIQLVPLLLAVSPLGLQPHIPLIGIGAGLHLPAVCHVGHYEPTYGPAGLNGRRWTRSFPKLDLCDVVCAVHVAEIMIFHHLDAVYEDRRSFTEARNSSCIFM